MRLDQAKHGTDILAVTDQRLETARPEGSSHTQNVYSFQYAGFTTAIAAIKHIDLFQLSKALMPQITDSVDLELK